MLRYFLKIPPLKKLQFWDLYKKENFKPEIKPMIENLQDEIYRLENKQAKWAKLMLTLETGGWKLLPSKCLKDRICKIKQYLNYILTIINRNILAILRTFLTLKKTYQKLYTKRTSTAEFVPKIPNRKKIINEHFNICEAEISLDEIIKSINIKIIKLQVMMALQQNSVNTFQMN